MIKIEHVDSNRWHVLVDSGWIDSFSLNPISKGILMSDEKFLELARKWIQRL